MFYRASSITNFLNAYSHAPITGQGSPNGQIKYYGPLKVGLAGFICFWGKFRTQILKKFKKGFLMLTLYSAPRRIRHANKRAACRPRIRSEQLLKIKTV